MKIDPYTRHYGFWSKQDQKRLIKSVVAVGGVGGVGAAQALMLAKSGVGCIRIADRDQYQQENVVEQAFATWDTIGRPKVQVAAKEMKRHSQHLSVQTIQGDLANADAANELVRGADILFSGVDNPEARIALGRAALKAKIPFVVGANVGWTVFATIYQPDLKGYAAAFESIENLSRDELGFPIMEDPATRELVYLQWRVFTVAFSGFRDAELRRFIRGDMSHFAYTAGPAFTAASITVMEGLKSLLGAGVSVVYPNVRILDLAAAQELSSAEVRSRYNAVARAWNSGPKAILEAIHHAR
ncbi:MAG: ThiF family adenylyltransferase [Verrucomicrobia bacterium]|nr:ThiF family adenylyltransferase [Verrucomicrobiota bacterium]MCH8510952.1 ThiF family adenylyltransferase [Kiritimatiellia bacterium]